MAMSVWIKSVI